MPQTRDEDRSPDAKPNTVVVLDAKGLRALAHPVRVQLVGLLRRHGPSTATQLAERMGLTSGATSYHLRQLAAAGFIDEDAERGNSRERWWKSLYEVTQLDDENLIDREQEAAVAYLQSVAAAHTLIAQRVLNNFPTMPKAWQHSVNLSDRVLRLTPQEAASLQREIDAVIARYRGDTAQARADAPAGAARVDFVTHLLPEPNAVDPDLGAGQTDEAEPR